MAESITRGGEIYFIRERDFITGELSPYVKVGLTRDDRLSSERQTDHQTANPRELFLHHSEKVVMVQTVEKSLHWQFASKRVNGEWFLLDEELLEEAVRQCRQLAAEFEKYVAPIQNAEKLSSVPSTDESKVASPEALEWWKKHQIASLIVSRCEDAVKQFKQVLRSDILEGKDVRKAAESSTQQRGVFDEAGFKAKYPSLWTAHLGPSEVSGKFTVAKMPEGDLLGSAEVQAELPAIESFGRALVAYSANGISLGELSKAYIQFFSQTEYFKTKELLAKHHLMSLCGDAPEIVGVCKWKRIMKDRKLNRKSLREAAPNEYDEFVSAKQVEVLKTKREAGSSAADDD